MSNTFSLASSLVVLVLVFACCSEADVLLKEKRPTPSYWYSNKVACSTADHVKHILLMSYLSPPTDMSIDNAWFIAKQCSVNPVTNSCNQSSSHDDNEVGIYADVVQFLCGLYSFKVSQNEQGSLTNFSCRKSADSPPIEVMMEMNLPHVPLAQTNLRIVVWRNDKWEGAYSNYGNLYFSGVATFFPFLKLLCSNIPVQFNVPWR